MQHNERQILSLLKSFLNNEISFKTLDFQWIRLYIEDGENIDYVFEDTLSEISEFIYWGSKNEPTDEEKLDGILGQEEVRSKIKLELDKCADWESFTCY